MHIRTRHAAPRCFRVRVFGRVGCVKAPLKLAEALVLHFLAFSASSPLRRAYAEARAKAFITGFGRIVFGPETAPFLGRF